MFKAATTKSRVCVTATVAALWLTACGGGGGGDDVAAAPSPAPAPVGAPAPAPVPAPPAQPLAWTATSLAANTWHWVTMNPSGTVQLATSIPGNVFVSRDSGATFVDSTLPVDNWISADMSLDGTTMVAVGFGGGMYRSTDSGASWTKIDGAVNPPQVGDAGGNLAYESVTMSQNGQRIVAVTMVDTGVGANPANGLVYVSQDGGATFTVAGGSAAAPAPWRAVDSSADGSVVVAAAQDGNVHLSTDGGLTFAALPVNIGAGAIADGWYRVAVSEDGNTIAVAGNTDFAGTSTGLYTSRDRGATWVQGNATSGAYTSIDMTADGGIMVATMSGAGTVLLSTNGGTSFAPLATLPPVETNWRAVSISGDAARLLLAAGTFFGATGQLYTSSGSVTAP